MSRGQPTRRPRTTGILLATALPIVALLSPAAGNGEPPAARDPVARDPVARDPVVVELFTSQGCSSCPPADRLLGRLAAENGDGAAVIPLSFQGVLGLAFGSGRVYTPQVVIDGRAELVGSSEARVRAEIEKARLRPADGRLALELRPGPEPGRLELEIAARVERGGGERWSVMVAVVEDDLETPVERGENGGRTLRNTRVVRSLAEAFSLPALAGTERSGSQAIELREGWRRDKLGVAVFLQDPASRQIHGAAALALPDLR